MSSFSMIMRLWRGHGKAQGQTWWGTRRSRVSLTWATPFFFLLCNLFKGKENLQFIRSCRYTDLDRLDLFVPYTLLEIIYQVFDTLKSFYELFQYDNETLERAWQSPRSDLMGNTWVEGQPYLGHPFLNISGLLRKSLYILMLKIFRAIWHMRSLLGPLPPCPLMRFIQPAFGGEAWGRTPSNYTSRPLYKCLVTRTAVS